MTTKPLTNQFEYEVIVTTTNMHTGGQAIRIVETGFPVPQGRTILEKMKDMRENHDEFRKLTIFEPRGHFEMIGAFLVSPGHPDADIGVIFVQNDGCLTMCGEACMALGRYAVDRGLMRKPLTTPDTQVNIQTPCGLIKTMVRVDTTPRRKTTKARFESVPAFVVATDVDVRVKGIGTVKVDVAYDGNFFAYVTATDLGLDFRRTKTEEFSRIGDTIRQACSAVVPLSHPDVPATLLGVIFVDSRDKLRDGASTNLMVWTDGATDRGPCGSGTTARTAIMYQRGLICVGQQRTFQNPLTGAQFTSKPLRETTVGTNKAIVVEIEGQSFYTGTSTFYAEKGDTIGRGFLVR